MAMNSPIGLRSVAAMLPAATRDLKELERTGLLVSDRQALAELGFEKVHLCADISEVETLALRAARTALERAQLDASAVDLLIWVSALAENHIHSQKPNSSSAMDALLGRFNYRASWLQEELHLDSARVVGIAQQGCAGMFNALSVAHATLCSDPAVRNVLCVGVDALPLGSPREILYNLISDAGCAAVLSRENLLGSWRAYHQVSKGYYWNIVEKQKEIIASYFPTSRAVIRELIAKAQTTPDQIRWILPTGVSQSSWDILASITSLDATRIYRSPEHFGHTIAVDNLLNLESLLASGQAQPGDEMLLFTYGFGSTWCGLILEKI